MVSSKQIKMVVLLKLWKNLKNLFLKMLLLDFMFLQIQ